MKKSTISHLIICLMLAFFSTTPLLAQTLIGGTEFEPLDSSSSFFIKDEQPPSGIFPSGANDNSNLQFIGTSSSQDIRAFRNTDTNTYPGRGSYDATKNTYLPSDNASKTLYNSKYVCTNEQWGCGDNAGSSFNTIDRYVFLAKTRSEEQNAIIEYKISDLTPGSIITVKASLNNYSKSTSYDGLRVRMILVENGKQTYSYSYNNNNGYIKNNSSYIEYTISNYTVKSEELTVLLVEDYSKANGVLMLDYIKVYLDYEPEPLPDPLPDAIVCDEDNIHEIFFEDFGQLPGVKSRKQFNSINGVLFSTSYNFKDECVAIKSAGDYAIVATPMYSGCTSNSGGDYENTCYCDPSAARLWYKTIEDHTPDDVNGGMMQFDCRDGSATDILYERTISGVCSNTLVNFSAWITKANVADADKFKARFLLRRGGSDGPIIGRKDVEDIDVNQEGDGWQLISAMFNSGDLNVNGEVTVQLINLAPYGQNGNDLLLDDLRLTVCTPHASLKANYGGALVDNVEKTCDNNLVELVSDVETTAFTSNYYLWQKSTDDGANWTSMDESGYDVQNVSVVSSTTATLYRLIVANTQSAAELAAENVEQGPCGLYAITNTVGVQCKEIGLTIEAVDDEICTGDEGQYIIKVTNPYSTPLTDLVIKYEWPSTLSINRQSEVDYGRLVMPSYQWTFDATNPLPAGATATMKVKAISTGTIDMHGFAYLERLNGESYLNRLVSPLSKEEIIWVKYIDVKATVQNAAYCEGETATLVSTVTSKCAEGAETYSWQRRKNGTTDSYEDMSATTANYQFLVDEESASYEYRVHYTREGCACNEAYSSPITIPLGEKTALPTTVTPYDACTTTGTLVYADLATVTNPENLTFYETATSTTPVESMSTNSPVSKYVYFTYTEDGKCASDRGMVKISIAAQPIAQITSVQTQRACAAEKHTFTISAVAENGQGSWSIVSGEASIANPDALTTTACVVSGQTAVLAWNVANEKDCKASATTTLIVDKEPVVTVIDGKGTQKACGTNQFTVAVNPDVPAGKWELISGFATIVSPTSYETQITGVADNTTVKIRFVTEANGQCASVKGPEISLTANTLPTAAFTTASSVLCASTGEATNAQVTFTGASPYELTYQVDEGTAITKTSLTSPYTIKEQMSASGTLQLLSVKDANGCVGTITGQTHAVEAQSKPTIEEVEAPPTVCETADFPIANPTIEANGSTITAQTWLLDGAPINMPFDLSRWYDGLPVKYRVTYTCGSNSSAYAYSNEVPLSIKPKNIATNPGMTQIHCNNGTFVMNAEAPTREDAWGTWSVYSGTATIVDPHSPTTTITDVPLNSRVVLEWSINNGVCPAASSAMYVENNDCASVNITAGAAPVVCDGSKATFTFTVRNGSPVATSNVTSTITLGAGLSDVKFTPSKGTISGNTWTISSMASGAEVVLTVVATVTTTDPTISVVINKAAGVELSDVQASQSATVNAKPTAAFTAASSEVCADAAELTNAQVTFTGASAFDLTYKVNGGAAITKTGLTSPYIIEEQLGANGTLQLVSVKDANGCVGTITGQNHTVVADYFPTIQDITQPVTICEGNALSLTAPSVEANGSTLGASGWVLNGASFDPSTLLSADQNAQDLKYAVAYTCGRQAENIMYSNVVSTVVDAKPSAAVAGEAQTQCNNDAFVMAATAPAVGQGQWTLVDGTANIQVPASATTGVVGVPVNSSATLQWTVSNGVCPANDSRVVLTNNECTNLNITAGIAPVVCDGGKATFTFTLTNNSSVTTTNIISSVTLGAGLSGVTVTPSKGTISGITWTVPSMDANEEVVLTIEAEVAMVDATVHVVVLTASGASVAAVSANQMATVHALPTATFQSNSSTICIDPQDKELTNIAVNFTGAAPFELTYVDSKGSTYVENNLPLSATLLNADLDADEAYTLVSVTDANGCVGTITGQTHQVSTQKHASLDVLTAPDAVCEGNALTLVAPAVINNNGATVTNPMWLLDHNEFNPQTSVTYQEHNGKELFYQITSSCNAIERDIASNSVNITVYKTPELAVKFADPKGNEVTATQITCAVPYLTATLSGAESYTWSDGSTDNPRTLGKKGAATTYEVSGVTEAGCVADPLTFTVTEDFVAPDVAIASSDATKILTCALTEITLTASSNTAGVVYKWDDDLETEGATLIVNHPNTYKVTATNPSNGCYAAATETIGINKEDPIVSIASVNAAGVATKTITCTDTELTLTPSVSNEAVIGAPVIYTWVDDATLDAQRGVTAAGTYKVTAKGANGCEVNASITIELDDDVPNLTLTASADTITCAEPVVVLKASVTTLQNVTYVWNTQAAQDSIHVRLGGEYSVVATAPNGCTQEAKVIIEQRTDLPNVVITSTDPKQYCRVNTLTAEGAANYVWNTDETTQSIEVSEAGTYWVKGTNRYGCTSQVELLLEEDKVTPAVTITKDIASITCTNPTAVLTATVTNAEDARTYAYQWSPQSGTSNTLRVTKGNTYKVVVTDQTNFCVGEKSLEVKEHKEKPKVDVQTLPAVCLPATIDLTQAVGPKTLADNVMFFEDEAMTKEVINTTVDVAQYAVYYVQGQQVNGNGCMGDAQVVAVNLKAETPAPVIKDYDECTKAGSETFSSLVTSSYYKLNFYEFENSEAPIADAFDASESNTTTTYYVTNTNLGACESERVPFTVHIEGLVDFMMEVSDEEIMIGDDAVTVTLIPASVDVEGYQWTVNGKEVEVDGEEYTTPLYVDSQFKIVAKGRCNALVQEETVLVKWPTAFTPYNNNGMNETFAKGLPVNIFNRFGILIYEGNDGWDGVMNKNMGANMMAVPGVYYYSVSLPDGNVKKGTIEVVKF